MEIVAAATMEIIRPIRCIITPYYDYVCGIVACHALESLCFSGQITATPSIVWFFLRKCGKRNVWWQCAAFNTAALKELKGMQGKKQRAEPAGD
jgi:hypothetical protein